MQKLNHSFRFLPILGLVVLLISCSSKSDPTPAPLPDNYVSYRVNGVLEVPDLVVLTNNPSSNTLAKEILATNTTSTLRVRIVVIPYGVGTFPANGPTSMWLEKGKPAAYQIVEYNYATTNFKIVVSSMSNNKMTGTFEGTQRGHDGLTYAVTEGVFNNVPY